jgi:hypothetical protein
MYKIIGGDQKEYGPVSGEDLRRWIAEGRLNAATLALAEGSSEWKPLGQLPEFAAVLQAQAKPAPPASGPIATADVPLWKAQLLATPAELRIGECLSRAWKLLRNNVGLLFGATLIVWAIESVCQRLPLVSMVAWTMRGVLYAGLYLIIIKRLRGQPTSIGEVFAGFSSMFPQLLIVGLLTSLLSGIGLLFCFVPGLYLFVAWSFSVPLVADKRLEFWSAMELSRQVATRVWFELFVLLLLAFLPFVLTAGFATIKISLSVIAMIREIISSTQIDPQRLMRLLFNLAITTLPLWFLSRLVLLLNLPFALAAMMAAYEDLFGPRPAPPT